MCTWGAAACTCRAAGVVVCAWVCARLYAVCVSVIVRARGCVPPVYPGGCASRSVLISVCTQVCVPVCLYLHACALFCGCLCVCVSRGVGLCAEGCGHVSVCLCMSVPGWTAPCACVHRLPQAAGADNCGCYCEPVNPPNPFTSCSQGITN